MGQVPKDTGWAWMCALGAAIIMFFVVGGFKSLGIVFVEVLELYGDDAAVTGWIAGVLNIGMSCFAPVAGVLGERVSFRLMVGIGGSLGAMATILGGYATSTLHFILIFSIILGIGYGCMMGNSLSVVGMYFEKRRSLANGLAMSGASVGQLVIPIFMTYLFHNYGFKGTFLIYGGFFFHTVVAALLLRPTSFYTGSPKVSTELEDGIDKDSEEKKRTSTGGEVAGSEKVGPEHRDINLIIEDHKLRYVSTGSLDILPHQTAPESPYAGTPKVDIQEQNCCNRVCMAHGKPLFDWKLLKDPLFLSYVFGICIGNSGYVNVILFIPPLAKDLNLSKTQAALLLSLCGLTDFGGRIFGGWFADLGYIRRNKIMTFTLSITGICAIVCGCLPSFPSLVVLSVVVGSVGGAYISLMAVVLIDYKGIERFSQAFGLTVMFMGLFNLSVPSIFGRIRDSLGSYQVPFSIAGCMMIIGAMSFFSGTYIQRWQLAREEAQACLRRSQQME